MRIVAMMICAITILLGERANADSRLFAPYQQMLSPEFVSGFVDHSDNIGTDQLVIDASPIQSNVSGNDAATQVSNQEFRLNGVTSAIGSTDPEGGALIGTLGIDGAVPGPGNIGPLAFNHHLTGNATASGSAIGSKMEFLHTITGSEATTLFDGSSAVGILVFSAITPIFDQHFNTNDDFSKLFSVNTASTSAVVPEPGTFLLSVLGVFGFVCAARHRWKCRLRA